MIRLDHESNHIEYLRFKTFGRAAVVTETDRQKLLAVIQRRLAPEQQQRLDRLRQKNESGELTSAEHIELLQITEQIENADAERASALIELARLHNKPVSTILHEYPPEYITNAG